MSRGWFRRRGSRGAPADLACIDFVEEITDYLDGSLAADVVASIDAHLAVCGGCRSALDQFRSVIALAGRLTPADVDALDDETRTTLLDAFRAAHPPG